MSPRPLLVVGWGLVALLLAVLGGVRLGVTQGRIASADQARAMIEHDVRRVQVLRSQLNGVAVGRRPDGDLIARVQRALADAGLPVGACSGVQPRADQARPGAGVRVQAVVVTLRALTPGEFGAWLAAWRAGDGTWHLEDLQLALSQATATVAGAAVASRDGNRYDATLVLAAPYVGEDQ